MVAGEAVKAKVKQKIAKTQSKALEFIFLGGSAQKQ